MKLPLHYSQILIKINRKKLIPKFIKILKYQNVNYLHIWEVMSLYFGNNKYLILNSVVHYYIQYEWYATPIIKFTISTIETDTKIEFFNGKISFDNPEKYLKDRYDFAIRLIHYEQFNLVLKDLIDSINNPTQYIYL